MIKSTPPDSRRVTKFYGTFQISASKAVTSEDGNHQWVGFLEKVDGTARQEFQFLEGDQSITLPGAENIQPILPPQLVDFTRFCIEVSRARC